MEILVECGVGVELKVEGRIVIGREWGVVIGGGMKEEEGEERGRKRDESKSEEKVSRMMEDSIERDK